MSTKHGNIFGVVAFYGLYSVFCRTLIRLQRVARILHVYGMPLLKTSRRANVVNAILPVLLPTRPANVLFARVFRRYTCDGCTAHNTTAIESERRPASFHAWDTACLERLPEYVSKEFPFILTHRSGIDISLGDRLADELVHGKGFASAAKYIGQESLVYSAHYFVEVCCTFFNRLSCRVGG